MYLSNVVVVFRGFCVFGVVGGPWVLRGRGVYCVFLVMMIEVEGYWQGLPGVVAGVARDSGRGGQG